MLHAVLSEISQGDFVEAKRRYSQLLREMFLLDPLDNAYYAALSEGILFSPTPDYIEHFFSTWPAHRHTLIGFEKILPLAGKDPDVVDVFVRICQNQL